MLTNESAGGGDQECVALPEVFQGDFMQPETGQGKDSLKSNNHNKTM